MSLRPERSVIPIHYTPLKILVIIHHINNGKKGLVLVDKLSSIEYAKFMHGKTTDKEIIEKIKFLRSQGYSLPEISRTVDIPKTTVFRYTQGVTILPEFLTNWAGKRGGSRKKRLQQEKSAFEEGKKIIGKISNKERMLFLAALYWAEGSKKDFGLSNTDPKLIRIFINGLREVFGIMDDRFRISVRIYEDLDQDKCLSFWSKIVGIPKEKFVGVNIISGRKKGKLEYGMCRVRITKGGDLLKKIIGINKAMVANLPL